MSLRYPLSFLLLLLFSDCNHPQTPLLKNLPDADYPKSNPIDYGFGNWFTIRLSNDSMSCGTATTYHALRSLDELEIIICEEVRKKNEAESNKKQGDDRFYRTLILEIDSSTRYELFDGAVEFLKHVNFNKFYIRTRNTQGMISGFPIVFPEISELVKPYLARLYGEKIYSEYNFYQDCPVEKLPPPPGISSPPTPPPSAPRSELPDSLRFLTPVKTLKSVVETGDFGKNILIEIQNGQLFLNKKQAEFEELKKAVEKPKSDYKFYIMLGEKNCYGDLVKIIDILYLSREKLNKSIAQKMYGMDYSELDRYQKDEVRQEEPFMWMIVSMSEQLFIDAN